MIQRKYNSYTLKTQLKVKTNAEGNVLMITSGNKASKNVLMDSLSYSYVPSRLCVQIPRYPLIGRYFDFMVCTSVMSYSES